MKRQGFCFELGRQPVDRGSRKFCTELNWHYVLFSWDSFNLHPFIKASDCFPNWDIDFMNRFKP